MAQQRAVGLRVELLMPDLTGAGARQADMSLTGTEGVEASVADPVPVPGPTAEWFYLDTRHVPHTTEPWPPLR